MTTLTILSLCTFPVLLTALVICYLISKDPFFLHMALMLLIVVARVPFEVAGGKVLKWLLGGDRG